MRHRTSRIGFTLIELSICLLIVGLMAAMVTVSLGGAASVHRIDDAIDSLLTMDGMARQRAKRFDRSTALVFDLETNTVARRHASANTHEQTAWRLPEGIELARVRVQDHDWSDRQVEVRYDSAGHSPTFAVEFNTPNEDSTFCVVAGLTGQLTRDLTEDAADAIFEAIHDNK